MVSAGGVSEPSSPARLSTANVESHNGKAVMSKLGGNLKPRCLITFTLLWGHLCPAGTAVDGAD